MDWTVVLRELPEQKVQQIEREWLECGAVTVSAIENRVRAFASRYGLEADEVLGHLVEAVQHRLEWRASEPKH